MKRRVKLRIAGRFDNASAFQEATATICRESGLVTIRPLRRRRTWELPLGAVLDQAVRRLIAAEVRDRKKRRRR